MAYAQFMHPVQSVQNLKCNPFLLESCEKRSCYQSIIYTIFTIFTNKESGLICQLQKKKNYIKIIF